MKKLHLLKRTLLLFALIVGCVSYGWAETSTLTFTAACGGSGTASDGAVWTVTSDGSESTFDNTKGIHYGTGSAQVKYITLTTSDIPGTITKVVVNASTANGVSATASVTIGGSAFGGDDQSLSSNAANYTFNGSASGEIVVTVTKPSKAAKAIYVKSITVTYSSGPAYTITAQSNNNTYGTVSLTGTTITATPESGYRVKNGSDGYSVTAGTATVAHEGYSNTLTVTPASDCTVQVNFEAIPTLSSISLTGTYPTVFTEGDAFSHEGMTVTANYSDESTNDVTASATFSGYNMSTTGAQTVTVSYTEDEVTKTTNYGITVNAIPSHTATFSVNGNTTSDDFKEGTSIVFPANPEDINGKTFVGWVTATIVGTTDDEPSFVNTSTATMGNADVTYYAVFATAEGSGEDGWTETALSDLTTSDVFVIVGDNGSSYAMTNDNGTTSAPDATEVTILSENITGDVADNLKWNISGNPEDGYVFYPNGTTETWLYCTNTNNGVRVGTNSANSAFTIDSDYLYNKATSRYVGVYNSQDWRCYTSNGGNIEGQTFTFYKYVSGTTYSAYCTTVSTLPIPVITLSSDAIEMTWGDEDKILTASATVGGEAYKGTITMTPSSLNLTIDGEGNIRCNVPGEYTITASIAETAEHQAAGKVCTVTVGKKNATVAFATATVQKMLSDGSYTQAATKDPDAAGAITYTISPSGNAINSGTGEVTLSATGNYTVTATAAENTLYNEASGSYTLQVRDVPTIVVEDAAVTYGNTFVVDGSAIEGGDITVSSGNEDIATVDGLTITPVAVGTVTITVSTAENDVYIAGDKTFELTVNAPVGGTTAAGEDVVFATLNFADNSFGFPETSSTTNNSFTDGVYTISISNVGNGYRYYDNKALIIGKSGSTITLPAFDQEVTQINVVGVSGASGGVTQNIYVDNTAVSTTQTGSTGTSKFVIDEDYREIGTIYKYKITNASNAQIARIEVCTKPNITVKLNSNGYATYCSKYPLDFSEASGYSAWQITSVGEEGAITFTKVTGSVKGGTGLLLKGEAGATITLTSEDSETVLTGNRLVGTLAPLNVSNNEYYGLSGNKFVKVNAGNVPAGKALLPATYIPSSAHQLSFIFEDEGETTGINAALMNNERMNNEVYNLNGQRVATPVKGNIYIVNGKKVMFK